MKWMSVTEMCCGDTEVSLYDDSDNRVLLTDLSPVDSAIITALIEVGVLMGTYADLSFPKAEERIYVF